MLPHAANKDDGKVLEKTDLNELNEIERRKYIKNVCIHIHTNIIQVCVCVHTRTYIYTCIYMYVCVFYMLYFCSTAVC